MTAPLVVLDEIAVRSIVGDALAERLGALEDRLADRIRRLIREERPSPGGGDSVRLLAPKDLVDLLGVDLRALRRLRHEDPDFPLPLQIGRRLRWRPTDIAAWVDRLPGGTR